MKIEIIADWYTDIPQTEQVFITRGFGVFLYIYFYFAEVSLHADGSNLGNKLDFTGFGHLQLRPLETTSVLEKLNVGLVFKK